MTDCGMNEFGFEISRHISRVVGIVYGIDVLYGVSYFMYRRLKMDEGFSKFSHFSDRVLLLLLFFGGLTGFLVTTFLCAGWAVAT